MQSRARLAATGMLSLLACSIGLAGRVPLQDPAAGLPENPFQPKVAIPRASNRRVLLSVVVTDKKGNYISGLTAKDFSVLDEGRPLDIRSFQAPESGSNRALFADPPGNIFSNRQQSIGSPAPSVTAILIDGLNNRFENLAGARNQTLAFLSQLSPSEAVSLYFLGERLYLLHDFSKDTASLAASLRNHNPEEAAEIKTWMPNPPKPAGAGPLPVPDQKKLFAGPDDVQTIFKPLVENPTLEALRLIAIRLATVPGRKNLIWISSTFPTGDVHLEVDGKAGPALEQPSATAQLAEIMNAFNIVVYPVYPEGLTSRYQGAASLQRFRVSMEDMARRTGGQVFFAVKDAGIAIQHSMEDSRSAYSLGVYAPQITSDDHFRRLAVKVDRPGAQVRTRSGYYPLLESEVADLFRSEILIEIRRSPLDSLGIGLVAHARVLGEGESRFLDVELAIDPQDFRIQQGEKGLEANFYLEFSQHDAAKMVITRTAKSVRLTMTPELYKQAQSNGMQLSNRIPLREGADSVRIIVSDSDSENIGTVTIPVSALSAPAKN